MLPNVSSCILRLLGGYWWSRVGSWYTSSICSPKEPVRQSIYTLSTLSNRKPAMTDSRAEIREQNLLHWLWWQRSHGANGTWDFQVNACVLHLNTWGNKLFIIRSVLESAIILHDMEPNEEKYEKRSADESVINFCYKFYSFLTFDPRECIYVSQYY